MAFVIVVVFPHPNKKNAEMKRKGESHTTAVFLQMDLLATLPAYIPTVRGAGKLLSSAPTYNTTQGRQRGPQE